MAKEFTKEEIEAVLDKEHWHIVNRWLARGDGIAVYRNEELGNPNLGHQQFVSYGSKAAQLEMEVPPQRMPDIGGKINWRYQLEGTYKGAGLGGGNGGP